MNKRLKLSEADFQVRVLDALKRFGWTATHFRGGYSKYVSGQPQRFYTPLQGDGVGFPDISAFHPNYPKALYIEVKSDSGVLSPAQIEWGRLLSGIDGCQYMVVTPKTEEEFLKVILSPTPLKRNG